MRNCVPSFIFTVKSNDVDSRCMKNGQLVNHYGKARSFTTKVMHFSVRKKLFQNSIELYRYHQLLDYYVKIFKEIYFSGRFVSKFTKPFMV